MRYLCFPKKRLLHMNKLKNTLLANVGALLCNLALVYVCYTLCRLVFLLVNWKTFGGQMDAAYLLDLFGAGLIFDTTAILYSNVLFILLFLFPLHWKERKGFYRVVRRLFVFINTVCLFANLADSVYFQFTGKRTTMSVFQEFANEGGGNFFSILWSESLPYWYLGVLTVLFAWLLHKLFREPGNYPVRRLTPYYIIQTLALLLAVPFTVFGMRGGMTMATRPITISNANQYVNRPLDAGIVLNTPFAIFRTLDKKPFVVPDYLEADRLEEIFSPIHRPDSVETFRPMNVVVFILESFGKQNFGSLNPTLDEGNYRGYTPFLDSLLQEGLTFEYSYSNGRKSIDGMPSVLSSIPSFVEPFFLTPASLNDVSSIAGELRKHKGYYTAFFHGAMNGSMGFEAFSRTAGFQDYFGRTEYNQDPNYKGDADFDGTWAIWDEEFLQFYCDKMADFPQPFVTSVFTATSHPPFALPERYKGKYRDDGNPFYACVTYTDNAMRLFFEKARKQPWFKNTLFVITADHIGGNSRPEYVTALGYYSIPIIFYAPGLPELRGYDRERVVDQIDIMPTVLGILGYDRPYVAFGQDVLHTPQEETFAVNYVPAGGVYQLVKGDYLIQFDGHQVLKAYRYRTDKLLQHDVKEEMPKEQLAELENQLKAVIQQYMLRMKNNDLIYREEPRP